MPTTEAGQFYRNALDHSRITPQVLPVGVYWSGGEECPLVDLDGTQRLDAIQAEVLRSRDPIDVDLQVF